ncbi:MAG: hypothetical protein Kow0081_4590 [Candidatus Dojkabacteria bacterium]
MKNITNNQKTPAEFFGYANAKVSPREGFLEALESEVLQEYINYYQKPHMEPTKKTGSMLKMGLLALGLVVVSTAALGAISLQTISNNNLGGEVVFLEGTAEYRNGDDGWKDLQTNSSIKENQEIRILGEGKLIINLDDGSAVRLSGNSTIAFTSLDPENVVISNIAGDVYTRVVKADRSFAVKVDEVTFKSLGTAYMTFNKETEKGVEVFESKVAVIEGTTTNVVIEEGNKYYIKKQDAPEATKQIIKLSQEEILNDEFIQWNKEQDSQNAEYAKNLGIFDDPVIPSGTISATATQVENGIKVSWTIENMNPTQGFKVVKSTNENPTFGTDESFYLSDPNAREFTYEIKDGQTYNFRVCQYTGNDCVNYSNNVSAAAPLKAEQPAPAPAPSPSPAPTPTASISLGGHSDANGINLNWVPANVDVSKGFKVVYSKTNSAPTYGVDTSKYVDGGTRSITIPLKDGKTYYFRVCRYTGNGCDTYSNTMTITAPVKQEPVSGVNSISLSGSGANVSWIVDGYSKQGYKVVYSKNPSPTYPPRSGDKADYISNPEQKSHSISAFDGTGTYYVRVCEYKGGNCRTYSNQIQVSI